MPNSVVNLDQLEKAFTWTAGGFTAVVAILTFFGIKEGTLDQALRLYPPATLCIFIFIGIGFVAALFSTSIAPESQLRVWALLLAIIVMLTTAAIFLPNVGEAETRERLEMNLLPTKDDGRSWVVVLGLSVALVVLVGFMAWRLTLSPAGTPWPHRAAGVLMLIVLGSIIYYALPRKDPASGTGIDEQRIATALLSYGLVITLLACVAVTFVRMTEIPTTAGLVIIAVASTSLGLYGATKLAVESKTLPVAPQVTAVLEDSQGTTDLVMSVKVSRLRHSRLVLEAVGVPRDTSLLALDDVKVPEGPQVQLWGAVLQPDALDEIDESRKLPIVPTRWRNLMVRYCIVPGDYHGTPECDDGQESSWVLAVKSRAPEAAVRLVAARFEPVDRKNVKAHFAATDVAPGVLTRVELCRKTGDGQAAHVTHVTDATLAPDGNGNVDWEVVVPAGKIGDVLVFRHTSCPPGGPCDQKWRQLASFVRER